MYLSGINYESLVDGEGVRTTIFVSGCLHNCRGCHNPLTHNFNNGKEFTLELQLKIINYIKKNPLIDGITISGGDPFFSVKDTIDFILLLKKEIPNINIWIYSGFTFEEILKDKNKTELMSLCNVLVDGKFEINKRDITLDFRGSTNQRIIDIQKSLQMGEVILYETR